MLTEMIHDKIPVKANQFLYKAILINTMFMMQTIRSEREIDQVRQALNGVFMAQIAYCEGDKNHPFLEEVISLMASLYESTMQDSRSAIYMFHLLLAIQDKMYGGVRKEMFSTFKKLGSLYFQMGNPVSAAKYFEQAQDMLKLSIDDSEPNSETQKELLESQENTYFSQYLAAA